MRFADTDRWASRALPEPNTGCWLWLGATDKDGYGRFATWDGVRERDWRAHRFAYAAFVGPLPPGLVVRHRCDGGAIGCVNPAHLELGTVADNAGDCVRRGRSLRGERNPASTTTEEQAREVLRLHASGVAQKEIRARLSLSKTVVWQIVRRKAWGWVGAQ